ncbi:heterogeneous nuclear ribonucleoprotein A2 homolog 2-like [Leptopilina heterotoma]|uniref:heterogeneous nuclear ribonucleoprotein A2 homolog 2-like n=1 Tax=Leptopilina heterotoma TaxID=63436 RepID=UPI001CA8AB4C|nr:heterogeneous nuclear ribonucleoprotein A2 homolog 2-like [Leptopilina heterotoma]
MVIRSLVFLLITVTINVLFTISSSHGKPANNVNSLGLVVVGPESTSLVLDSTHQNGDAVRVQRSPQRGLLNDDAFEDYSDDPEGRHLHKRKHKRKYHGGFGCNRKHGCGGWQGGYFPSYGGHYPHQQFGHGGSFATASGGFFGGGHHGGNSQANAQSASFNFGPFSFNLAQAGAGGRPFF